MARSLQHQVAARLVHPVEHHHVAGGLEPPQALRPAGIELDGAERLALPAILGAVLTPPPGRADAADEIEAGIKTLRQLDRNLALAQPERVGIGGAGMVLVRAHAAFSVARRRRHAKCGLYY